MDEKVDGDNASQGAKDLATVAGAVVTVAPVLILFLALQRYYIRGMLAGSVKG